MFIVLYTECRVIMYSHFIFTISRRHFPFHASSLVERTNQDSQRRKFLQLTVGIKTESSKYINYSCPCTCCHQRVLYNIADSAATQNSEIPLNLEFPLLAIGVLVAQSFQVILALKLLQLCQHVCACMSKVCKYNFLAIQLRFMHISPQLYVVPRVPCEPLRSRSLIRH